MFKRLRGQKANSPSIWSDSDEAQRLPAIAVESAITRGSCMPARPSWEGHLRLSLVTCPVALYAATTEAETVRFNLINPQTNNRIKMKTVDAGTGEEVSRGDLVKGYAIAKNEYVLLDAEDFESVKLESTRIIDIEKFVPRASIDRLYWDTPYHLVTSGKTGVEAFAVIREAMKQK